MKIIAFDRFKPGVTLDSIKPYLRDEVSNVWRLWKAGVVRENYARADRPGVVIVFECESVEMVRCYVDDFAEILETLGANEVISSSKSAFEGIATRLAAK